jgi:hypothetical protein
MNMEGNPIQRTRKQISSSLKPEVISDIEKREQAKKERVDVLMEKIKDKKMEKVHINFILLNSGLPHDFVQGYFTGDEDYFYTTGYDLENLNIVEEGVKNFDIARDEGKMFPTSSVNRAENNFLS